MYDIIIIGGGASGMTAAITAKEQDPDASIAILEKLDKTLAKVKASGNGRCNMTNEACENKDQVLDFFREIGVLTHADSEGRIYPYTDDSAEVVRALNDQVKLLGIDLFTNCQVNEILQEGDHFSVGFNRRNGRGQFEASKVLIAAGGKSAPKLGSTGDGAVLAGKLGLPVTRLAPALTGVVTEEDVKSLQGIRARAEVSLYRGEERIFREKGEVQFTEYGLSGICIFNMSRFITIPEGKTFRDGFADYEIRIDLVPGMKGVRTMLEQREDKPGFEHSAIMRGMVRPSIANWIYKMAKRDPAAIDELLHGLPFKVEGLRGWQFAQVTHGGVELDEINSETMESKSVPGLFLAGEVLNYDGPCGGFNLQHAFETGMKAGRGMIK